jgi:serine/threonine protein kinase
METLGKYQIVEKIGVGGFGVVYKGYDPLIKRHVAIKTCSVEDTETRQRFQREAEIAGSLQHRNIVTVFEFGFEGDTPYLVQEYLSGEDLDRKIKRNEYVPLSEKILWLIQAARGLAFAHERGIVHRDVKPANVRILDDGTAKILDFGIAKLAHQTSNLTQVGMTLGTAAYLAPEQIRAQAIDARTDVFSFGILAYELLAYERPFRAAEISAIFYKILHETPASLAARVPDLPVELDRIVARCLEKDPLKRWAPTDELVHAMEKLMQKRPGSSTLESIRTVRGESEGPTRIVSRTPGNAGDRGAARPPAQPTAPPPAPPAARATDPAAPRPNLDDLGFHYSDTSSRVHSRSMAAAAFGAGRKRRVWPWALGLAAIAAGALGLWVWGQGGSAPPPASPTAHASLPSTAPPARAPATPAPAAPATTAGTPKGAAAPGQGGAPERQAPTAEPAKPPEPVVEPPKPGVLLVGPAWDPGMQVRVAGHSYRLDRQRRVELAAGSYSVSFSVETSDYSFRAQKRVRLDAGESQRLSIPIDRPGQLTVQPHLGTPSGIVRIDGQVAGPAPLRGKWLQPGDHRVEVFPATGVTAEAAVTQTVTVRSQVETVVTFDVDGRQETQVRERPTGG